MINSYIIFSICILLCIILIAGVNKLAKQILRLFRIKNFPAYQLIFSFYLDRAYDVIYKDRIFTFSAEGYRLDEKEHAEVMKEYVKLVIKMLGPSVHQDLISMYGSENTLIFNIYDYFNEKYEKDEIRGAALDNLSNKEEEEEPK